MRGKKANAGSLRALLFILALLAANLAIAISHRAAPSRDPGSARASSRGRGIFGAPAENFSVAITARALGEAPSAARELPVLPGSPPREP